MKYGARFGKAFIEARKTPEYWMEEVRLDFVDALMSTLEVKNISQKELARRIGKTEAYISKIINSNISNFTLKTMTQLSLALGSKLSVKIQDIESIPVADWKETMPVNKPGNVSWEQSKKSEPASTNIDQQGGEKVDVDGSVGLDLAA